MAIVETRALCKIYGSGDNAVHALRGVDLEIRYGSMVVLLGSSGSGKSTLLNILGGLDSATGGHAWFYDRDVTPSMPDGPVPINLIGTFVEGFAEFAAVCRRMKREGVKRIEVRVE